MSPVVLIALAVGLPILLFVVLRINAAIIFLSLCLGSVLVDLVGSDAATLAGFISPSVSRNPYLLSLALLFLPALFTVFVMIHTVRGKFALFLNILPAAAVGAVGLLLAIPLSSPGLIGSVTASNVWHELEDAKALIVTVGALVSLLFLWLQRPKGGSSKDKRKHR